MKRQATIKKPLDRINTTPEICPFCLRGGGRYFFFYQLRFSYCDGPRWEPELLPKSCTNEDYTICPFNPNVRDY